MTAHQAPATEGAPLSRAEDSLLHNLTEAIAATCRVLCAAVVTGDGERPSHVAGDATAAASLARHPAVQRALAQATAEIDAAPAEGALAEAAFIAVEPINIHGAETPHVVVLAGHAETDRECALGLLHALAIETASEMTLVMQAPFLAAGLAAADCGITIADPNLADTPLIYVNDTFARMTGYRRGELMGRNCRFLQGHLRDQPQIATIRNAIRRGLDCTVTLTNIRRDGTTFANRLKLRAVRTTDGTLAYYVGVQLDVTAEQTALDQLQQQKRRYESLVKASASYIWHLDAQGQPRELDDGWLAVANLTPDQARREGRLAALAPDEAAAYRQAWQAALAAGRAFEAIYHLPTDGPEPFWFLDRVAPVRNATGELVEWIATTQDITARKQAEEDLNRIVESAPIGMIVVAPEGTIDRANQRTAELFGYTQAELAGMRVEQLVPAEARERHRHLRKRYVEAPAQRMMGPGRDLEGVRKDGSRFPIEVGLNAFGQGNGMRVVAGITDITERKKAEREIWRAAYEDRLTGLASRAGFTRALAAALAEPSLHPASMVVAIDVRALRDINNVRGYDGGDAVLQEVARRLNAELDQHGLAARISGDEFALLVPIVGRTGPRTWRQRLDHVFANPFDVDGFPFYVRAAFGYTRVGRRSPSAQELMHQAELALHQTQHEPARSWTQYTRALAQHARRYVHLTQELRQAVMGDEFELHYQPKVDLARGKVIAAEALLRWRHPQRGLVPPGTFIPAAEASQLIGPIGDLALEHACRDVAAWRADGLATVPVSVNASIVQFTLGGFPAKVGAALARHNLAPQDLVVEITESVFRDQGPSLRQDLDALRAMGVGLALDDFGSGYSSLLYLNDYPFDEIKIDKGFVLNLDRDPYGRAIVTAVLEIAGATGAHVVAEGVETAEIGATLAELGCPIGQGFYYSKPVPDGAWRQLLAQQREAEAQTPHGVTAKS